MIGWTKVFEQFLSIKIRSITDSLFRYGLIFFVLGGFLAVFKVERWITIVLFSFGGLMVITGLIYYRFFCNTNPDYLRTEEYQLAKNAQEILGDKENSSNPNAAKVIYIANPNSDLGEGKNLTERNA